MDFLNLLNTPNVPSGKAVGMAHYSQETVTFAVVVWEIISKGAAVL